ncbi:hypothetical protein Q7C36_011790 [Tachysurus vachellii]|uniref:Uncharacterized protein n=1 Tax=Tachysurus vachellii TaxID=175792 RepID=A0AA88MRF3_TACVA|nr:hypothetical protein Q7C36_011790 [Tachysurus vachellii]
MFKRGRNLFSPFSSSNSAAPPRLRFVFLFYECCEKRKTENSDKIKRLPLQISPFLGRRGKLQRPALSLHTVIRALRRTQRAACRLPLSPHSLTHACRAFPGEKKLHFPLGSGSIHTIKQGTQAGCILAPIFSLTLWPVAELLTGCHKVIGLKWRH